MTQMEAKSHGESYLGRRTESYQVVASHAGLCFRTSMNQYSACFPFQPFLDKRLYMAVHWYLYIHYRLDGWRRQITCVFSSQVFRLRRSVFEELYKNHTRNSSSAPEIDFDGEILTFSQCFLRWDSQFLGRRWVYFACVEMWCELSWSEDAGQTVFSNYGQITVYPVSHALPKKRCWHTSSWTWGAFATVVEVMLCDLEARS